MAKKPSKIGIPAPDGETVEPTLTCDPTIGEFEPIPRLAFGLYKIPQDGDDIILEAIEAGYRHFDTAEFYGNEQCLGRAIRRSGIPRSEFYITGKVWKTSMTAGPSGVRKSIIQSLEQLGFEGKDAYFDLFLIHWPVPGLFVDAYLVLQELHKEGMLRSLGLSNFNKEDYTLLKVSKGIVIPPICNQMEVSVKMYRPDLVRFFQQQGMIVFAFKPLGRGELLLDHELETMANEYQVGTAQLLLRWCIQHDLAVASKSSSAKRMQQNRDLWNFEISSHHMQILDKLTTEEAIDLRTKHEEKSKALDP